MKVIHINHEPVELYKILKFENLVYGGGEAKVVIAEGLVQLNGVVETQKRKKIHVGDVIEFDGEAFQIQLAEPAAKSAVASSSNTPAPPAPTRPKRSKISF